MAAVNGAPFSLDPGMLPSILTAVAWQRPAGDIARDIRYQCWVLDYVRAGAAHWRRNGRDQRFAPGRAYLYRPGDVAGGQVLDRPLAFYGILFTWGCLRSGYVPLPDEVVVPEEERAEFEAGCPAIVDLVLEQRSGWDIAAGGRLVALLTQLAMAAQPTSRTETGMSRRLARAAASMRRNLSRPLRMADVARVAGLSEAHLRAAFTHRFGQPPLQFLIEARLREVRRLLAADPQLAIEEACRRAGFGDRRHAGRLFKRRYGLAMDAFRRSLIEVDPGVGRVRDMQ